jgi:hypothetical protein
MKTSELTGVALDWAVAKCEGEVTDLIFDGITWGFKLDGELKVLSKGWAQSMIYLPSTNWSQGGPIIERELIETTRGGAYAEHFWKATRNSITAYGPTPLIAAMRCYVASKLGGEVDIPEELE